MDYPKRLLICGLGSIGCHYVQLIKKKWPFIELAIIRSGKGGYFPEIQLANKVFTSYQDAINWNPNACIISSPATYHLEHAITFANANIPL